MELTQGRPEHRTTGRSTSGSHQPFWASGCRAGAPPTRYSNAECYHLGGVGSSEGRRRGVSRVFRQQRVDSPVAETWSTFVRIRPPHRLGSRTATWSPASPPCAIPCTIEL